LSRHFFRRDRQERRQGLQEFVKENTVKKQMNHPTKLVVEVDFAELPDGSLVEMIQDPTDSEKSLLAVYKNGTVRYTEELHDGNRVLVPLSRTDLLLKHIRLPQGAEPYGELKDLEADVSSFFQFCLDVEPDAWFLMIAHVLSSWFPEKLPVAPYLALVGPPGSGKTTAIRILGLLCRRSLLTSDITSAAFYEVSHRMRPTLLIDETITAGHSRTLLHLLRTSNSRGFVSLRKNKAQMAYGPKVLAWLELPKDAALNSRSIIIPMHKTARTDLKSPDDPNVLSFAKKVRMRLLQLRLENYKRLSLPKIPAGVELSSRMLDLYRALALPFEEDPEFRECLAHVIAAQRQFQPPLLSPAQASALRSLWSFIHEHPTAGGIWLRVLTTAMNGDLASLREPSGLNERTVGDILTSLGLTNRTRKNSGYVLWLDRSVRVLIHKEIHDYEIDGVATEPDPKSTCDICVELSTASPSSSAGEVPTETKTNVEKAKRERREHRERHPGGRTRSPARSGKRLRSG
jgi:hypothetical protein